MIKKKILLKIYHIFQGYREKHHSLTWNSLSVNSYSRLITDNKF